MGWATTRRWPGHRLLDSLANTILELGLPRIRAWLQQRFGPEADVARVRLEGGVVSLEDARLPLGGAAVLLIESAHARVGSGPSKLRLLELRGAIRVAAARRFDAPVEFEDQPGGDEQWVHGRLTVRDASWTASHGEDEQAPLSGALFVQLSSTAWSVREGSFRCAAADISLAASGTMQDGAEMPVEQVALAFTSARAGHLFDALLALAGQDLQITRALPWTALLDGQLRFSPDVGLRALLEAGLGDASQRLRASGQLALDGALSEVELDGGFDPRVIPLLEPALAHLAPELALACTVRASVEGSLEAPQWTARLELPALELRALPDLRFENLRVDAKGDASSATLHAAATGPAGLRAQLFAGWDPAAEPAPGAAELHVELGRSSLAAKGRFDVSGELRAEASGGVVLEDLAVLVPGLSEQLAPARAQLELELEGQLPTLELSARAQLDRFRVTDCTHDARELELRLDATIHTGDDASLDTDSDASLDADSDAGPGAALDAGHETSLDTDDDVASDIVDSTSHATAGLRGVLRLDTPSSALRLEPLHIDADGSLEGSQLLGKLSSQDLQSFVRIDDPVELLADAHVHGDLRLGGSLAAPILDGDVRAASVPLRLPAGGGRVKVALSDAAGRIRVEPERFIYERVAFAWASSRLRVSGELPYSGERGAGPAATVEIVEGQPALVATVASIAAGARVATVEGHKPAPWVVPASLRAFGVLSVQIDGELDGQLGFETGRSALMVRVNTAQARLRGTVSGHLALVDLGIVGVLAQLPAALEQRGRAQLQLELGGTLDAPEAKISAEFDTLSVALGRERFTLDALQLQGHASAKAFAVEALTLRRGEGELSGSGEWRFDRSSARAELRWRDLMVDDLPLDTKGEARVRNFVTGRSAGQLELHWVGQGLAGLSASGRVSLEQAAYPFLYRFRDTLRRLGLPEPRIAGTTPAGLVLKFDGRRLQLEQIRGAVRGCAIEGHVGITYAGGALDGQLHATVPASYLRHSSLLALPAALTGDLRVPVAVGGTVDEPRFDPDVLATLGNSFGSDPQRETRSRVDQWFQAAKAPDIPDDLRQRAKGSAKAGGAARQPKQPKQPKAPKQSKTASSDSSDAAEDDELIRQMMAKGVDMAVIERMLERRRRRRRGDG